MLKSQGSAYVAARDKLLESGAASEILKAKLTDSDWRVQAVARAGLERLSRPQAYAEYDAVLAGGLRRAGRFRGGAIRSLSRLWYRGRQDGSFPRPRESRYGAAGVPFLLEALAKGAAPPAGWYLPEPARAEAREAALEHYSRAAQCYAVFALSFLADPRGGIAPLLDVMRTGEFSRLRRYAGIGLGWTGRADVIAPLRKALGDDRPDVRQGAASGLGQLLTAPDDPDLLWLAENDPDRNVRRVAASALLRIRSRLRIMEQGGRKVPYP
jgi:HEAT repeat protein